MHLKLSILYSLAVLCSFTAFSQDRLYTKDGKMQEVKVKEIGTRSITYKKWNNQDGPDFVIAKREVERIKFQNGDEESFGMRGEFKPVRKHESSGVDYRKNIISLSPIHMTNTGPVCFGLSYERVLDRNRILSFYLPVVYSFKDNDNYNAGGSYDNRRSTMVWTYPGVKIYPTGSDGVVRYSVGPSLVFGAGNRTYDEQVYNQTTGSYMWQPVDNNVFVMGFMANNTLNINPTPNLHLALELGLGLPYYTNEKKDNYSSSFEFYSSSPLVQFNFSIGYRF